LGTYKLFQTYFGTHFWMGPPRLANKGLGTQMAFVLECGELITFLAQESNLGLLSIVECIDKLGLRKLPMGQSFHMCLFL
jgi:hypothetical protein